MSTVANKRVRSTVPSLRGGRGPSKGLAVKSASPAEATTGTPVSGGSAAHRSLRKHLVSASELTVDECVTGDALSGDDTFDLVSVARFPPGIAAVLRKRVADAFTQALQIWDSGVSNAGQSDAQVPRELSSRGALGLSITPTPAEDYRVFDVMVDIMSTAEVTIIQTWKPDFDIEKYPPLVLAPKAEPVASESGGSTKAKSKAKSKAKASSNESSLVSKVDGTTATKLENWDTPIGTVKLVGLLTELPSLIESYKTLDSETMVKSANISQMLVCIFSDELDKHVPTDIQTNMNAGDIHDCCERFLCLAENSDSPDDLLFDPNHERLLLSQCPWLWPSGITPPLYLHRERRDRPFDLYSKQEIQTVEAEMISIIKKCPQEKVALEVSSALECYLQHEALQRDSSVPNADQVLNLGGDTRLVHVVTDGPSELFDDPDDNLSDQLFGEDFHLSEADLLDVMRSTVTTAQRKRRDKTRPEQTPGMPVVGPGSLEDEFDELAQLQVRKERADQLDQELEDEFYSEAVIEDSVSSVVHQDPDLLESAAPGFTSMKVITRDGKQKSKSKKK
eukprot:Gregarina_sp_Poly_1__276@NODE_1068_length_5192_cov_185_777756_g194_i1_p1_GENE_NODE_1068_length_5192_cov_185_777756_g194_i1NODE_1068_length_5192_cov_185_777756_g194_i1_p1_ORF_typecomplete_len564_score115_29TAFII55_N/PF04658_13/2_2e19_NODE_1068_length_5192_cov_185_777756_g194_i17272418